MGGAVECPAHVLSDPLGRPFAVFSHWSDAKAFLEDHPARRLVLSEQPGLLELIERYCAQARIGQEDGGQKKT